MKLKNILIVVKDINKARQFYHDLFGLELVLDNDGNMMLTEGLVLQEERYWAEFSAERSFRRTMPARCILRSRILKALLKSWKGIIPRSGM